MDMADEAAKADGAAAGVAASREDLAAFVRAWDALVVRRPEGEAQLPVIVLTGEGSGEHLERFRERLLDVQNRPVVPLAYTAPVATDSDDREQLFDDVANRWVESMPPGSGSLKLPRYWTLREIIRSELHETAVKERRKELRARLYDRFRRRHQIVDWFGSLAGSAPEVTTGGQGWARVIEPVVVSAPRRLFGEVLRRGPRFRWLDEAVSKIIGGGHQGFWDVALALVPGGALQGNTELIDRLLVAALLRDLEAALEHPGRSPRRRRRIWPFVVMLRLRHDDRPGRRFVQAYMAAATDAPRNPSLLMLAAPAIDDAPTALSATPPLSLREAADALGDGRPVVGVDLPALPERADTGWLDGNRKVVPDRVGLIGLRQVGIAAAALTLVALATTAVVRRNDGDDEVAPTAVDPCPGISERDGELVGLGDGTMRCSFVAPGDTTERGTSLVQVERQIARQNEEVLQQADAPDDYRTVVALVPVTTPDEAERLSQSAVTELRAFALAQQEINRRAADNRNHVPLRLIVANPADRFAHGATVAQQILDLTAGDETVVGVVGIGQSRDTSFAAVEKLGQQDLPVIGGTTTGDFMVDSPHYYQIAPNNDRIAETMVRFTLASPPPLPGERVPAVNRSRHAVVVEDHTDAYSHNLADDLRKHFAVAGHEVLRSYSYPSEDRDEALPDDERATIQLETSLEGIADDICQRIDPEQDVIFYAARSQQLGRFLDTLEDRGACSEKRFRVVAGDSATKFVPNPNVDLSRYPSIDLYYAAFASPQIVRSDAAKQFVDDYVSTYGPSDLGADMSDPAMDYDALFTLSRAINDASQGDVPPTPATVALSLGRGVDLPGASGYIDLGNGQGRQRVSRDKPILILPGEKDRPQALLRCGRFTKDVNRRTWGPGGRYECPVDDTDR